MLAPPHFLVTLAQPWADFYSHSKVAPTLITFVHLGALLLAGGLAVATDRATLRLDPADDAARARHLAERSAIHRTVVGGLAFIAMSGVLLFASDVEAHFVSWIYWAKMTLVVLLLANGYRMTRIEQALAAAPAAADRWNALRGTSMASLALWFTVALFGVMLVNLA